MPPKVLDLTYVVHEDDLLSTGLAHLTFLPFFILICLGCNVLFKRCLQNAYFLLGLLLNTFSNSILKSILKQPRPPTSAKQGYGMPSDHSQFMMFFAVYLALWLCSSKVKFENPSWKYALVAGSTGSSVLVFYSRVHLGVHTWPQVAVGVFVGGALGFVWYLLNLTWASSKLFPLIEGSWIGKYFYLRDTSEIPNLLQFEYHSAMNYKRNLKR
eukprot:TRINITY_DN5551_c0_g3_i1.p1 TRINITY_DN5551_c0_g3~~TRINITY_DN5551_c0_g3_i1.p1  ORF type:complete len:213 (-),score=4.24 TRINITY_DN5551_c0_g3_i1:8-646(-)